MDWKKYFDETEDVIIADRYEDIHGGLENLYQAFKARLMDELQISEVDETERGRQFHFYTKDRRFE